MQPVMVHEYSNVADFLLTLTHTHLQADVLLAPVFRPQYPGNGTILLQAGVMLNGHPPGYQGITSCIALAAEATLVAERGRLLFPECDPAPHPGIRQRIHELQQDLLVVLIGCLRADARVSCIRNQESLWKPTTLTWSPDALNGLPIVYQQGHWRIISSDVPS